LSHFQAIDYRNVTGLLLKYATEHNEIVLLSSSSCRDIVIFSMKLDWWRGFRRRQTAATRTAGSLIMQQIKREQVPDYLVPLTSYNWIILLWTKQIPYERKAHCFSKKQNVLYFVITSANVDRFYTFSPKDSQ